MRRNLWLLWRQGVQMERSQTHWQRRRLLFWGVRPSPFTLCLWLNIALYCSKRAPWPEGLLWLCEEHGEDTIRQARAPEAVKLAVGGQQPSSRACHLLFCARRKRRITATALQICLQQATVCMHQAAQWMKNWSHPLIKEPTNTESVCPEKSALYIENKVQLVSQKALETSSLSNISKPPTDRDRNSETEEEKQFSPGPPSFSNLLHLCFSLYIRTYPSQQTGTRWGLCHFHNAPLPPCYLGIK